MMVDHILKFAAVVLAAAAIGSALFAQRMESAALARPSPQAPAASAPIPEVADPSGGAKVELRANPQGHFLAEVEIENRTLPMLVDTGATIIALTPEDADRIGIRPARFDYTVAVSTANGMAKAAPVRLRDVRIGRLLVRDVEALVMPPHAMGQSLLGMSFLKKLSGFEVASGTLVLRQ